LSSVYERRLHALAHTEQSHTLSHIQRGIEKESLRVDGNGRLAQTSHPSALGSALCHPCITTDYSEALLEFITPVCTDVESALATLDNIHRYVYSHIGEELLWTASMPCVLEGDDKIPVALYGSSNTARMKTVYRYGLGHRYGRLMQTIAGIHYNFSMPADFWPQAQAEEGDTGSLQDYITRRYLGLIRNFKRHSWLLIYLFGASPAVCASFLRNHPDHGLQPFDETGNSLHLPYGTSLRMGDLGYQSDAQKNLNVCYNSIDSYIDTLKRAITTSYPDYEAIGVGESGHERQLSTGLLQIENEFYSPIRPKRVARPGETPLCALRRGGIEYVEVRCVDINPFQPLGIDAQQMRFLDTFLLYCLLEDSPPCDDAERAQISANSLTVVNRGREPGLVLQTAAGAATLQEAATTLLAATLPLAELQDSVLGGDACAASHRAQAARVADPELTPSAQVLRQMREQGQAFFHLAMGASRHWAEDFRARPLPTELNAMFEQESVASLRQQLAIEAADTQDFETFLANYYRQYDTL